MHRFNLQGYNADIDTTQEDVWSSGGDLTFPAAAAASTIESSDANDDGSPAGTGARTCRVLGIDADFDMKEEDVTLNGVGAVALANTYLRILRVEVLTVGSGGSNAGVITVKIGADTAMTIPAGYNRSQAASFTAPSSVKNWRITKLYGGISNGVAGSATFILYTRKSGGAWQRRWSQSVYGTTYASFDIKLESPIDLDAGEDVRLAAASSANNTAVVGGFDVDGSSAPL